jgi:glycine/D-amino acid oxidase-like deaminating enzyme
MSSGVTSSRDVAYQIVHDELMLDGNARLNGATFVTTAMEPLVAECSDKNMIDNDEYPAPAPPAPAVARAGARRLNGGRVPPVAVSTIPLWLDEPLPELPAVSPSARADVVVVGGGVTGCSCALTLARGGLRVRLVDAREIAAGASGRNGGFALRGLKPSYDDARQRLGRELAASLWLLTERTLDEMSALAGNAFRRTGSVRLANDAAERAALIAERDALIEDGFEAEWLDPLPSQLRGRFAGGLVHPGDGALTPAVWVRRLAGHAAAAGVEIVQHAQLTREAVEALDAHAVVLAVDGLTDALAPELARVVAPVRGQVLATEPLPELLYDRPHYARYGYDYWQQTPEGRLVLGGRRDTDPDTERTAVERTTAFIQDQLSEYAAELMGRPPVVTHRWAGIWGESFDGLPFAGRIPGSDRLWVAGGYSGHGNVLGFACGDLVARAILGRTAPELAAFDPARIDSSA